MRDFPHDLSAERAVIGACLISPNAVEAASPHLTPDDFHVGHHGNIWRAIVAVHEHGRPDPITVAADLAANGHQGEHYTVAALNAFTAETPTVSSAGRYAQVIAAHSIRRRIIQAGTDIAAAGWDITDPHGALEAARNRLAGVDMPIVDSEPDLDFITFTERNHTEYDWLIPGVLEHRDRLLITAVEGGGKSTLLTQMAFQTAAGLHWWTGARIPAQNAAIIDCENSARLLSRRLGFLRAGATKAGVIIEPGRLRVHSRPEGLDLTSRADRHWLIERCVANDTRLLVIGPAYRLSAGVAAKGDIGGEDHARQVTKALDEVRNRCNVTLIMETHAPHGGMGVRDLRPFGSSVWLRWPEFGLGLRKESEDVYSVEHWRGPRDTREWPASLQRHRGPWPWTPIMPIKERKPA